MNGLPVGILDSETFSERIGVTRDTFNHYVTRGTVPKPDGRIADRPWWHLATVEAWIANRPGRGAGGGRPWPAKD